MFLVVAVSLLGGSLLLQPDLAGYHALKVYYELAKVDTWLVEKETSLADGKQSAEARQLVLKFTDEFNACLQIDDPEVKELGKLFYKKLVPGFLTEAAVPMVISNGRSGTGNVDQKLGVMFYPKSVANHPRLKGFKFFYSPQHKSVVIPLIKIDPAFKCAIFLRLAGYARKDLAGRFSIKDLEASESKLRDLELRVLNLKTGKRFLTEAGGIASNKVASSVNQLWQTVELEDLIRLDRLFDRADSTEAGYRAVLFTLAIGRQWESNRVKKSVVTRKEKNLYSELQEFIRTYK